VSEDHNVEMIIDGITSGDLAGIAIGFIFGFPLAYLVRDLFNPRPS
jgi:hypothetical protein